MNKTGIWCYQKCVYCGRIDLCEHNMKDASIYPGDYCTEHGKAKSGCFKGSAFSSPHINDGGKYECINENDRCPNIQS